jgi:hypothetical protein
MPAKRVEGTTIWFCTKHDGGAFGVVQSPDITNERGVPIRHAFETDEDLEMHKKYACSFVSKSETRQVRHPQQQMVAMKPVLDKKTRKPVLKSKGEVIMEDVTPLRDEAGHTVWHYVVTGEKEIHVATQLRFTISGD